MRDGEGREKGAQSDGCFASDVACYRGEWISFRVDMDFAVLSTKITDASGSGMTGVCRRDRKSAEEKR